MHAIQLQLICTSWKKIRLTFSVVQIQRDFSTFGHHPNCRICRGVKWPHVAPGRGTGKHDSWTSPKSRKRGKSGSQSLVSCDLFIHIHTLYAHVYIHMCVHIYICIYIYMYIYMYMYVYVCVIYVYVCILVLKDVQKTNFWHANGVVARLRTDIIYQSNL